MKTMEDAVQEEIAKLTIKNDDVLKNTVTNEHIKLLSLFPEIVKDLTRQIITDTDASKWFEEVLRYNVLRGRHTRAITFVITCKHLEEGNLSESDLKLRYVMGWCIELIQACLMITDDIMDNSETRRGRLCWYRQSHVGYNAVNDAFLLESAAYALFKMYHKGQPHYVECIETLHNMHFMANIGQSIDNMMTQSSHQLDTFTESRYQEMTKYKTCYYTLVIPMSLAMCMTGVMDKDLHERMEKMLTKIGIYLQSENDFLDCYGDVCVTKKSANDIQEGKCTWLIVIALKHANEEQRLVLKECYGSSNPLHVERVKSIYNELDLPRLYYDYSKEFHSSVLKDIDDLPSIIFQGLCKHLMNEVYVRKTAHSKEVLQRITRPFLEFNAEIKRSK